MEVKKTFQLNLLIMVTVAFIAGLVGSGVGTQLINEFAKEPAKIEYQTKVTDESSAIIGVVEKTKNSVVSIVITKDVPIFEQYFGFFRRGQVQVGQEKREVGAGTGFIVSKNGYIITNKHVVYDNEASYTAVLADGEKIEAKVIDKDEYLDIAVLKVDKTFDNPIPLGNSDNLQVGQRVIAIGNSLGEFSNTVSAGIVSGLSRSITAGTSYGEQERLDDVIQTDASVNSGNSGGPLLDLNGNAVGVNVAVVQNAENIGFAIPINEVKTIIDSVNTYGEIVRPFLGIRYIPINKTVQEAYKLEVDYGIYITKNQNTNEPAVVPNSPADKAGLLENDIILEINGEKLDAQNSLQQEMQKHTIGETLTLTILRSGKKQQIKVTLEKEK